MMNLYHSNMMMMMTTSSREEDDDEGREDMFDRLPDALLHMILENVRDARSLSRCLCVSKRFASFVPQIDSVSLAIVRRNRDPQQQLDSQAKKAAADGVGGGGTGKYFKRLFQRTVARPVQFLLRVFNKKSSRGGGDDCEFEYCSLQEGLRNFSAIKSLEIELPRNGGEIGSGNDGYPLLRWRAEFGSELEGCVILGAKSFNKTLREFKSEEQVDPSPTPSQSQTDFPLADEDLKLRVVWTISCLIAASARHHLLQQVVSDHKKLRSVVVSDAIRQGKLSMKEKQIEKMRRSISNPDDPSDTVDQTAERSRIPALKMKLWYVPELELPLSGERMEGATLVVIRPSDDNGKKADSDGEMVARVLGDAMDDRKLGEAVKIMMNLKRTYTLEMNSF
ncbi:F-box protein At4g18380-like [Impatiens glandulifera]|uniref:F-box protein At4g18380-like n=1 Tax=Impatiens glandulifera TaxID=253017 RepID=UPI001FB15B8C|nr:F-box protein At4g18380-like [Impatiens glandulifera]